MRVHLRQIPQGGALHLEGEASAEFLDLGAAGAEARGPLRYGLDAGISHGGLFVTGWLRVRVRMVCVVSLDSFEEEIAIESFAVQKELDGREVVDLSPEIREEIQLALPAHPRSRNADEATASPDAPGTDDVSGSAWEALDNIQPRT